MFVHYRTSSIENPAYFSVKEGQQFVYGIHEGFANAFRQLVKKWELSVGESLTLLYNVQKNNVASLKPPYVSAVYSIHPYTKDRRSVIFASGFIYRAKSGEFAEYLPSPVQGSQNVILAVMFSEEEPTEMELLDLYNACPYFNCALWIHPTLSRSPLKLLTFRFDCIQAGPISNLPEPPKPWETALHLSHVVTGNALLRNSGVPDSRMMYSCSDFSANERLTIQKDRLTPLFHSLGRLRMSEETCIAVGYETDIQRNIVWPKLSFSSVRIFQKPTRGGLRETHVSNRYAETGTTPKLAFLFSGGEIDMAFYKKQLFGYLTALSLNIEDASGFKFYRMN